MASGPISDCRRMTGVTDATVGTKEGKNRNKQAHGVQITSEKQGLGNSFKSKILKIAFEIFV